MSRPRKDSSCANFASTSEEVLEQDGASSSSSRILRVTLLADEWGSLKGGLSTINRELAKQLAKHSNVEVTLLVSQCSGEDRKAAGNLGIAVVKAKERPGYEPLDWLAFPPSDLSIDVVVGHGVKLGRQAQIIRESHHCKWVQVVHIAPEELAMFRSHPGALSRGEENQQTEIELCEMADFVVAVGPKIADDFSAYLRSCKREVFVLTPSILSAFSDVEQVPQGGQKFRILVFGRGDPEDFELKGYDIAAQAVAELKDRNYHLIFVGAPSGKEDEVKKNLLENKISPSQLTVRSFCESRERLAKLFCEADLAIMPSRSEAFGLTALEALSAGLPVLVCGNSGFAEALRKVPFGSSCVVGSEDAKVWAEEIKRVQQKDRESRLEESEVLRTSYAKKFNWEKQCEAFVEKLLRVVQDISADVVVSKEREKRLLSSTEIQGSKRPKLMTGTNKAFRYLPQLGLETKQIHDKEVDLFNDLKQNARNEGFMISNNRGGGNCMFYSLAEQLQLVKGISISHGELRRKLVAFLWKSPKLANGTDLFSFVAGYSSWTDYLKDMEKDGTWGDHVVLVAAANCFQVPIHVISSLRNHQKLFIHPESPVNDSTPLVLGHVHELHYVSLRLLQGFQSGEHRPSSAGTTTSHPQKGFQSGEYQPTSSGTASHPQNAAQSSECVESLTRTVCLPCYELRKLISCIKDVYIRRARLQPVPWSDTSVLSLQRVYTRPTMKARKMQNPKLTIKEVKMYDIFFTHGDCKNPRSVLVEGDPGIGKTTFCLKMANDWATEAIPPNCFFPDVELVLLLKCRDVDGNVQKAIEDQLFPKDVTDQEKKSCLEHIQQIEEKLLLILDGLDELPEHARQDVNDVLLRKIFPRCLLVVTARQERGIHVRKEFDTRLEITGFIRTAAFGYIKRHFRDKGEKYLADALMKEIENQEGKDLLYKYKYLLMNPLNTVLLCLVFEECKGKLPSTRTELYQSIVFCLLKRFCIKKGIPIDDSTLFEQFEDVLIGLGKLALDGLKEHCMYFSEKKLNSSTQQVPQMGFVSKEASTKVIKPEHNYSFPHKTFQEFFAALYLAHLVRTDTVDVYGFISSIRDIEGRFRQVFLFVAGVLGKDGRHHFELLGQLIKEKRNGFEHPWEFLFDCFKESGHIKEMAAATARSMPISELVIENRATLRVIGYCGVQDECKCEGHKHLRDKPNRLVTFGDVVLPSGLDKFLSESTSLQSLTLRTYPCCVPDAVLGSVGNGLSENTSLISLTLYMPGCDLNDATLTSLGKGLFENTSLTSLTLNMSGCRMNDATLASLGKGLSENTSLTSLALNMSWCDLNDATLASLGKGLSENTSLTSLTVNMSKCRLNDAALAFLGKGLSENTSLTSLTLNMSRCHLNNATLASFSQGLSKITSLTSLILNMSRCHLNDATLASLYNGLLENTSLTSLTLKMSRCHLNDVTLAFLGKGLSENTSLTSLTLKMSRCRLNDATLASFSKCLSENTSLTSLTLKMSLCHLNGATATLASLSKCLSEKTSLTSLTLNMSCCHSYYAILPLLAKGLSENTSLTSLTVNGSVLNPTNATLSSITKCLSRRRREYYY